MNRWRQHRFAMIACYMLCLHHYPATPGVGPSGSLVGARWKEWLNTRQRRGESGTVSDYVPNVMTILNGVAEARFLVTCRFF